MQGSAGARPKPKMKSERDLGIFIKLNSNGWIQRIFILAGNEQTEKIVFKTLDRILKRSCKQWIANLMTRAGAMF